MNNRPIRHLPQSSIQPPANANDARCRVTPQGAAAAPGLRVAQALPKPVGNVAAWGGSALAAARKM